MRRFILSFICGFVVATSAAMAGTFPLTDGSKISGSPDSIQDKGVVFQLDGGDLSPRISWDRFTGDALKELMAEAKTEAQREMLRPMIESLPEEVAKRKEISVKPVETPPRPKQATGIFGLFGSPVGWFIMIVLYGANLFAAYEVCIYRRQPLGLVMGLAAIPFLGVVSPIVFGAMKTQRPPPEPVVVAPTAEEAAAQAEAQAAAIEEAKVAEAAAQAAAAPSKPVLPEPIVYKRGETSFNRRFFEGKFAGFFRVVPSESEKDLVLAIATARGNFVGRRISKITQTELYLQVTVNNASSEEMIPFTEISEVQVRHKDLK